MTEGFASIPNWMFREDSLSIYAVMVYGALASHQGKGGIYPSRSTLARESRCSLRKVAEALNELEDAGAITRSRRISKKGQASNGYTLNPGGSLTEDEAYEVEAPGALTSEVEAHGALGEGTSAHLTPLIEEEPLNKNPSIVSPATFEEFWAAYPRKVGKSAALAKWAQLGRSKANLSVILAAARRYAADPNLPEKQFIPHPLTWLNQGRWEDEPEAPRAVGTSRPTTVDHGREVDRILREQAAGQLAVSA